MNRDSIDRFCERGILVLALGILVLGPLCAGAVRTPELAALGLLTAVILGLWIVRLWMQERPKLLWPPVCWAVGAFALYALWRYFTCDIEYIGRLELLRVLIYTALFFAIINNLHRQETTQIISFALIFLAMVLASCAVWQLLSRTDKVPALSSQLESVLFQSKTWYFKREYLGRASATYINPNHLAGFLEMLLPLALTYVLAGRGKALTKVLLGYAALVILVGIVATGSRGSWAATGVALFGLFSVLASHRSYRLPSLAMLVLLMIGGFYFLRYKNPFHHRVEAALAGGKVELDMRQDIWDATVRMWRDHPWVGVGPGHFNLRFPEYRPASIQLQPDRAHNEYLNVLVDWGAAGAAIVAGVLGLLVAGVLKTWRFVRRSEREFKSNRSDKFAFVAGAAFGLVALLVHSVVDFNLHIPANAILAASLVALLSSHLRFATEQYWTGGGMLTKALASVIAAAAMICLGQQSVHLTHEYSWLASAAGQGNFSDERVLRLEKANAIEPRNFETTFGIAESYRVQSFEGGAGMNGRDDYQKLAQKAMTWYSRGTNTNRFDDRNYLGLGRCLDWLGRTNESPAFFSRADELEPNNYFTAALIGQHYVEIGDYAAARIWLERSLSLQRSNNVPAAAYLEIANDRLFEAAARANQR